MDPNFTDEETEVQGCLAQAHRASKWYSQNLNSDLPDARTVFFIHRQHLNEHMNE